MTIRGRQTGWVVEALVMGQRFVLLTERGAIEWARLQFRRGSQLGFLPLSPLIRQVFMRAEPAGMHNRLELLADVLSLDCFDEMVELGVKLVERLDAPSQSGHAFTFLSMRAKPNEFPHGINH